MNVSLKFEIDPLKSDIQKEYKKMVRANLFAVNPYNQSESSDLPRHASVPVFKRTEGIFMH